MSTTYTLAGKLADLAGGGALSAGGANAGSLVRARVEAWGGYTSGTTGTENGQTRLGTYRLDIGSNGAFSVTLPATGPGQGWAPEVQGLRVVTEFTDPGSGQDLTWSSDWFELTANMNLSEVPVATIASIQSAFTAAAAAAASAAAAQAAADSVDGRSAYQIAVDNGYVGTEEQWLDSLTGPANTLTIGTVEGGPVADATFTGTAPAQTLNLTLPKGDKGDPGPQGLKGDTGNTGATGDQGIQGIQGIQGLKGDKGDTGNTGPANTLAIGTVTEGAAAATITGTAPAQTLNLVVPKGNQGVEGLNVFGTATLVNGSGTTSAVNPTAVSGRTVKIGDLVVSAHTLSPGIVGRVTAVSSQTSVTVTYVGTWRGATGATGTAATVGVGAVTTGAAGSSAAVVNSGTSGAAVLDFTIPRGDKGDKGDTGPIATALPVDTKTAAYTLVLADAGALIRMDTAATAAVTVPTDATVAFPIGTVVYVEQVGVGQTSIAPASGVVLRYSSSLTTRARYSTLMLHKQAANEWHVSGDAT